jgi:CTP:molybdopterin cytidylyltransferase MocA
VEETALLASSYSQDNGSMTGCQQRLISVVYNASPGVGCASEEKLAAATAGVSAVLLHISESDSPRMAHEHLRKLLSSVGQQVQVARMSPSAFCPGNIT